MRTDDIKPDEWPQFQDHQRRGKKCLTCDNRQCTGFGTGKCPCCSRNVGARDGMQISRPSDQGI